MRYITLFALLFSFAFFGCGNEGQNSQYYKDCRAIGYNGSDVQKCADQMDVFEKCASGKISQKECAKLPDSEI
jgi:hypothetical protein